MDKLLEFYLFNPQDQLRLELQLNEVKSNEKQQTIYEKLINQNRPIGTNHSSKRISSNDLSSSHNLRQSSKQSNQNKNDDLQSKLTQLPLQQNKESNNYGVRNIYTAGDSFMPTNPKNKSQSYSQTLRNYKWISYLPAANQNNIKTPKQQPSETPKATLFGLEQNYYTPMNSKKVSVQGVGGLSNSSIFTSNNVPLTPHQRVMRIKNKQINLQVQRQFNNLILDSQNNFIDSNLEAYYNQRDQIKNNSISREDIIVNASGIQEQPIGQQKGSIQSSRPDTQLDHINIYLNQKTPESLFSSQTPSNIQGFESPSLRYHQSLAQKDRKSTSLIEQKEVQILTPQPKEKQQIAAKNAITDKLKFENGEIRAGSVIQHNQNIWKGSKRGSNFNGRIVSPILYDVENIEKSPLKKIDGTWSHSFYKHIPDLHKQMKPHCKIDKQYDFEDYMRNQATPIGQSQHQNKQDTVQFNSRKSQAHTREVNEFNMTPQNVTYNVHTQKDNYKPIQISKAFREQYKNLNYLLNEESNHIQNKINDIPSRNKSYVQSKSKAESTRPSVSNISHRVKPLIIEELQSQSIQNKLSTSDNKSATFSSNFPIQKYNPDFRFSKVNFKRKNQQSPKKTIFKI